MTNDSFTQKQLSVIITLASGTFANGANQITLSGLRISATIDKAGHPSKNTAKIKVYGMLDSDMNKLTTVAFRALSVKKNYVQIQAGDEEHGMGIAYQGEIAGAFANYKSPPNLDFQLDCIEGYYPAIAPCAPKSYKGGVGVATVMASLAKQMGYTFENKGVSVQVHSPYLIGSAMQQAHQLVAAANIEFGVDNGILFIAPRGAARDTGTVVPLISAATGMKEYPVFNKEGIEVTTLYNPSIVLGGIVNVQSVVKTACGNWRINGLKHHLESLHAGGKWESKVTASWVGE
jgi:hypothetical protein